MISRNFLLIALASCSVLASPAAEACTRIVYQGKDGLVLTGRSMDFKDDISADLWAFPRGIERNGNTGPRSPKWTSKYGSLVTSSFNVASTDGINEKGLVGNVLWLTVAKYPPFDGTQPGVAISLWLQYALDNFATVAEAVETFRKEEFVVVSSEIPGTERFVTVHLSLSDASGDSAILEYVDGKLVIHHSRSYTVMTNEPVFEDQLAVSRYWQSVQGTAMLPGTSRASDRFARASFYLNSVPKLSDPRIAVAQTLSIVRNASVPYGITTEFPNISTTQWRVVADQKNLRYYFESATSPNVIWADLKKIDLRAGQPVRKLALGANFDLSGDVTARFVASKPFEFAGLPAR